MTFCIEAKTARIAALSPMMPSIFFWARCLRKPASARALASARASFRYRFALATASDAFTSDRALRPRR
jgi:hypothetical protein